MTDAEIDARLARLLKDDSPPAPDDGFAERVMALAAHDLARRKWRRRATARLAVETAGFLAVLAAFALLARAPAESAGFGDTIPLASPAFAGLLALMMWGFTALSPARR